MPPDMVTVSLCEMFRPRSAVTTAISRVSDGMVSAAMQVKAAVIIAAAVIVFVNNMSLSVFTDVWPRASFV